jgi:hypothetical protein
MDPLWTPIDPLRLVELFQNWREHIVHEQFEIAHYSPCLHAVNQIFAGYLHEICKVKILRKSSKI